MTEKIFVWNLKPGDLKEDAIFQTTMILGVEKFDPISEAQNCPSLRAVAPP